MVIKQNWLKKVSLLVVGIFAITLGFSQSVYAATDYRSLSPEDQARSLAYYKAVVECFRTEKIKDGLTFDEAIDPTKWFSNTSETMQVGVTIDTDNGYRSCNNLISAALNMWGYGSDATTFLAAAGWTKTSSGWDRPDRPEIDVENSIKRNVYGGSDPVNLPNAARYALAMIALLAPDVGCRASDVGEWDKISQAQRDLVNTDAYVKVTVVQMVGTTATPVAHLYKIGDGRSKNDDILYRYNNVGETCAQYANNTATYAAAYAALGKAFNTGAVTGGSGSTVPGAQETCNIAGVGWLVCPVATAIGWAVDGMYTLVEQLLVFNVENPFGDNPLFKAWSNVRNVANVAFIIAFFIVIFSQATSVGLSNYGIKKMLPRMIVAAILVNLSYYLCIFAIDVSNILGAGIDGVIEEAGKAVGSGFQDGFNLSSWIANALVGGGAAAGAFALITSSAGIGYVLGGLALTFGLAALMAILTALIVLIARQAILIMLIILAPLAFVAYILPNTENLFDKWRKTFITMLVFYPLVALLFSGSQLAAGLMRSASGNALVDLFSLGVQAFPLFATPFILKFSGGLLGRVAGMVNNPNKGPFDAMRKAGEKRLEARGDRVRKLSLEGDRKNKWAINRARGAARRNAIGESMKRLSHEAEQEYIGKQLEPDTSGNPANQKFANKMAGAGAVFNRDVSQDSLNRVMAQGAQTVDEIEAKNLKAAQVVLSNARMDGAGLKELLAGHDAAGLTGQIVKVSDTMRMAAGATMMSQGREMDTVIRTLATSGDPTMQKFAVGQMQANYSKAKEKQVGLTDEALMQQVISGAVGTDAQFNAALSKATARKAPDLTADFLATQEKSSLERIKLEIIDTVPDIGPLTAAQSKVISTAQKAISTPSVVARMNDDGVGLIRGFSETRPPGK